MNTLNSLFDWIITSSLRATVLMLLVLVAQWAFKKRLPSRWRYALWLPVLVALLVPAIPLLPAWMNWPVQQQSSVPIKPDAGSNHTLHNPTMKLAPRSVGQTETILSATSSDSLAPSAATAALPKTDPRASSFTARTWLIAVWLIGTGAVSLFVIVSFILTLHRIRRARLDVEAELLQKIERTSQLIGLRKSPRVLKSSAVVSPAVCGLWRPTLLLNEGFPSEFSDDETDMILRHELTHIHRADLAMNALLCPLLAFHWFNPLLWIAFFRVRADREAACDAQVLSGTSATQRAAYGHTLLKMETQFPPTGLCLGFVGILQRGGTLRDRIHAIISQPQLKPTMKIAIALSIGALTIAGIAKASEETPDRSKPNIPKDKPDTPPTSNLLQRNGDFAFRITHEASDFSGYKNGTLPEEAYKPMARKNVVMNVSIQGENVTFKKTGVFIAPGLMKEYARSEKERIFRTQETKLGEDYQLSLKQTKDGIIGTLTSFGSGEPVLGSWKGVVTEDKAAKGKQELRAGAKAEKASAKDLFKPIVKLFLTEIAPDYNRDAKFIVSEYEIEGLWDTLSAQLFLLNCGPDHRREVFAYANGNLTFLELDSFASSGVEEAAISHGSLYFTHSAGSGMLRTPLVKLSKGKDNVLTYDVLGSIKSNPPQEDDKLFAKKMADVIAKLRPVKQGAKTKPVAAPKSKPVDGDKIKDKVSVKFGAETISTLRRDGDRLLPHAPNEKGDPNDVTVKITIQETTATPTPVEGDPTRSYLSMSNSSDKLLSFRALTRLKGSTEFYEMEEPLEPVKPGELTTVYCWGSGTLIDEMILYQFTLSPEAAGAPGVKEGTSTTKLAAETTHTVDGTQAKRIETITKQLSKAGKLPGILVDAEFVEEQIGDGILGPSDFFAFYALKVTPADLPAWRAALSDSKAPKIEKNYAKPKKEQAWWVKKEDFGALEFFSPKTLTGRSNGWIGIAPDGRIFIYAFTM